MSEKTDANLARLGEDKATEIATQVLKEIEQSEKTLSPWKSKIVKYYELYKMVQSRKHYQGLANIFVPEILRAVETIVANLYKVIFGQNPFFEYTGREDSDDDAALAQTQLTSYQMDENGFKARNQDALRQMAIAGLIVGKIGWDFDQIPRRRKASILGESLDPITGQPIQSRQVQNVDELETVRDHWTFDPVDLLGFHISDVRTPYLNIRKARWIAEEYRVDKQWLKEKSKKKWISKAQVGKIQLEDKGNDSDAKRLQDQRIKSSGFSDVTSNGNGIRVIERWGLVLAEWVFSPEEMMEMELEPDDMVEGVVIIANRTIVKLEANPFFHNEKPYVSCPYVAQSFEFSGIGVSQIGEALQEELNDTRNQTMDNKTLILMCMWLKHRASGIKNQDLRVKPLGVISTNMMDGLQPLRPPVLTGVGVNIEGVVKDDLRQSVGASSNLQGIAQAGVDTATESSLINKESFGRLMMVAEMYGELVLKPTLIMAQYLNYQFYDHIKVIKIIGPQGVKYRKLSPDDIASTGCKDVIIRLNTDVAESPAVQRQQLLQFLTILQTMPPELIQFHWKLLDKLYKKFFDGRSLNEIYKAPPEAQKLLTPEEEMELVLAEYPVQAQEGQDHKQHIDYLQSELEVMKFSMTPVQLEILKNLVMQHYQLLEAELIQAQAMATMQEQAQSKMNTGQVPNASKDTQKAPAKSESTLRQDLGR